MACVAFFVSAAANAVGTLLVDYLAKPVERCVRYLFRFNKIVEELQEQKTTLTVEQTQVKREVEEAKLQTQVIDEYVEDWLTEAENALDDVQSLEHRIAENKRCFCQCPNWYWRYQLSKKIERKTKDIVQLVERTSHFLVKLYGHRAELTGLEFLENKGYVAYKSSVSAFSDIMGALKDGGVNMIGVWGMGGVGKTTLVKEVCRNAKELQLFGRVIKVIVSQTPEIGKIQDKIADFLDLKFKKNTEEGKAEQLWLRLKNEEKKKEEKVLIVLDDMWDMWDELDLKKIGIPVLESGKGCTIILTTRNKSVCEYINTQLTVSVNVLDEGEAWKLFEMNASLASAASDIIEVAKKVAKECGGLPIAIVTLARALRTKDLNGWKLALKKLESSKLMDIEKVPKEVQKNAYLCLEMSYKQLGKTTKKCFLLCALYPEDYSIDVEDLVRYAWGLRIYQNAKSIQDVREEVFEAINNLKDSCLLFKDDQKKLEEDKKWFVKMHDVVRDVARWIATIEDKGLVSERGSENESSKQKLEIVLVDNYDSEIPTECFQGMPELKVLSLSRASTLEEGFFSFDALKSLKKLQTLQVEGFKQLEGISALAKLTKLEILNIHGAEFPESIDELGELQNIKLLDLRQCKFLQGFPSNMIQRLLKLEECLFDSTKERPDAILSKLKSSPRLVSLSLEVSSLHCSEHFVFPRLERYRIAVNTSNYRTDSKAVSSRFLRISGGLHLNAISELLWDLEFLGVSNIMEGNISFLTDTTPGNIVPVATILQNLKGVSVNGCKYLEVIFQMKKAENHAVVLLSKLEYLILQNLPNLERIWKIPSQHVRLQSLESIRLGYCGMVKYLLPFSLAQSLVCLEELHIDTCVGLRQIVEELEDDDEQEISRNMNPDRPLCLPKLRILEISNCKSLEYIFPNSMEAQGLPQLQELSMMYLSQLKQICRPAKPREELLPQLQILPSFTNLTLSGCEKLTDFPSSKPVRASLAGIQLSKLKADALFNDTKNLFLERIIGDQNLIPVVDPEGLNELTLLKLDSCCLEYLVDTTAEHVPNCAFGNLEELVLRQMRGLKLLCNGQSPVGFLQNLKKLTVLWCGQLQWIFQSDQNQAQLLSNLEHLELNDLGELRWILKGSVHYFRLRSLKVVRISNCPKLESLFSLSHTQSLLHLEELQIKYCGQLKVVFTELESDGETESDHHLHPLCLPRSKILDVDECRRLGYLLPINFAQGLPLLEKLKITSCDELKAVFAELGSDHGGVQHCINLPRLEILELKYLKNLRSFCPENDFVKAPALKELAVFGCYQPVPQLKKFTIQQEVINRVSLQFIRLLTFKEVLRNTKDLSLIGIVDQKNLIPDVEIERLTSLKLESCEALECLADTTEEELVPTCGMFTNLVELFMKNMTGFKMLCKGRPPRGFLQDLETLMVDRCNDIVSLYPEAQNLKTLTVKDCKNLREIFPMDEHLYNREVNQAPLLLNLEYLELYILPELRWILKGSTQYVSLQSLKVVKISSCHNLKTVFSASIVGTLSLLEEIEISSCDKLESVFMELEGDDDQVKSNTLCLKNLKTVVIIECPSLKYVLLHASAGSLPCLQKLQLYRLENLSSFDQENHIKAPALEHLEVSGCPGLSNFTIQQDKPLQSKHSGGYNFTSSLATMSLGNMIWLQDIWKGHFQVVVTNIRELEVYRCNRLTSIFPDVVLFRNLPQLMRLFIRDCEKLEQIIVNHLPESSSSSSSSKCHEEDEKGVKNENKTLVFPRFKNLCLSNLPSLTSFNPVGYHLVFPCLESLVATKCSRMITRFTMDSSSSVHAKTKAPRSDNTSPSNPDIDWRTDRPTASLPPYVVDQKEFEN